MLSIMDTPMALTMVNPVGGGSLRIARDNPAYKAAKLLAQSDIPVEQAWLKIKEILHNPLEILKNWLARFDVNFVSDLTSPALDNLKHKITGNEEDLKDKFLLGNHVLADKQYWLGRLSAIQSTGGNPKYLEIFLDKMAKIVKPEAFPQIQWEYPLHVYQHESGAESVNLLCFWWLPDEVAPGDAADVWSRGSLTHAISITDFNVKPQGNANVVCPEKGVVLYRTPENQLTLTEDMSKQPMLLGFNRTYVCEEGSPEGWLETQSTDSLKEAKDIVTEVRAAGYEARIISRMTKEVIG